MTWLLLSPLLILVGGIASCEAIKASYDHYLKARCAEDGGVKIFEHIAVSPSVAASMRRVGGHLSMTQESASPLTDLAFLRGEPVQLRKGHLSMFRHEQVIVRRSDQKVVGRVVRYSRAGGDFPFTGDASSVFSCPDWKQYYADIATVFKVEAEAK